MFRRLGLLLFGERGATLEEKVTGALKLCGCLGFRGPGQGSMGFKGVKGLRNVGASGVGSLGFEVLRGSESHESVYLSKLAQLC